LAGLSSVVELSVVIPVYRCAECLDALYERLVRTLEALAPSFELVMVDDRSPDGSWDLLVQLAQRDARLRAFRLSRNFGQHAAITAGLAESRGRWTVVMDCDLQDPPEEIPRLLAKAQEGYDIVLARRVKRQQSWLRGVAARTYFRMRNFFLRMEMGTDYSTLSVLSRKVVDAFLEVRDRDRQYMLIIHWLGFERAEIEFEHRARQGGESSYAVRQLVQLAIEGFFFETTILLRWIVYLGFGLALTGALLAAWFIVAYFLFRPYAGWTSVAVLLLLVGGFIITSLGVTGLYVGRIFAQVKDRPLYVVDSAVNPAARKSSPAAPTEGAIQKSHERH
jgi:glycosyltransferase involved in cell wall biosynthesis